MPGPKKTLPQTSVAGQSFDQKSRELLAKHSDAVATVAAAKAKLESLRADILRNRALTHVPIEIIGCW
jgi:hypothetical protein